MNKKHLFVTAAMSAIIGISSIAAGFSSGIPVLAEENTTTVGPVICAQKYLVMDEDANVPNVTFKYTIAAGEAVAYNSKTGTAAIISGPDAEDIEIGRAVFSKGQTTYTSEQAAGQKDSVKLKTGQKYAKSDINIDLKDVTFKEPGVYRYVITEDTSKVQGITYDETKTRCLDVYIKSDEKGKLSVAGSVLHRSASELPAKDYQPEEKDNGFQNLYTTHDLTITKNVKGSQGSHNRYFKFTVEISSAAAGTAYNVNLDKADTNVNQDSETLTNPSELTVGADGTVTAAFMLRHGQSVCIQGIADNTKYEITEDVQDYDSSVTVNSTESEEKGKTGEQIITKDSSADFVNTKEGDVPTGISGSGALWIVLLGAGVFGFALTFHRKKKD